MENRFGDSTGLTFASWMAFAVPLCFVNLILSWMWLSYLGWKENKKYLLPGEDNIDPKQKEAQILKVMKQKYTNLGPLRCHELSVLICFIIVILLWFFRKPLFMFGKYRTFITYLRISKEQKKARIFIWRLNKGFRRTIIIWPSTNLIVLPSRLFVGLSKAKHATVTKIKSVRPAFCHFFFEEI